MQTFSAAGQVAIHDIAQRHGFSDDAVVSMLEAVMAGHGRMAQFTHREFGGSGQWMRGGMTMVSDLFDTTLKTRVQRLCDELAQVTAQQSAMFATAQPAPANLFAAGSSSGTGGWWPPELGRPAATGSQNDVRYAYFSKLHRLAVDAEGRITVYDTLDHQIGGVSQQQSANASLTFSSQRGSIDLAMLPIVSGETPSASASASAPVDDVVATIEKLAELTRKGILTEAEFSAKKTDLLGRM